MLFFSILVPRNTNIMEGPEATWEMHERQYRFFKDRFSKRSLRPSEYKLNYRAHIYVPYDNQNRLKNEAASLRFIKSKTNIPVPNVLDAYGQKGSFYLWTELVSGLPMNELSPQDQAKVMLEV
jgi:aminoglycoside phosphotransferase